MRPASASEDWLLLVLHVFEVLRHPSFDQFLKSLEVWDDRERMRRRLRQFKRVRAVEGRQRGSMGVPDFTERGRRLAWGGELPGERWARPWDGRWRLFVFDLPEREAQLRFRLWRWLRSRRYGYLQQSVWLSPDPISDADLPLKPLRLTPESYVVLESRPVPPAEDGAIVQGAWDFEAINAAYDTCLELAVAGRSFAGSPNPEREAFCRWLGAERRAWMAATVLDPLLPQALLPPGYRGQGAVREREATFRLLAGHACRLGAASGPTIPGHVPSPHESLPRPGS